MQSQRKQLKGKFIEKFAETMKAVLPILAIVLLLCFTIAPIPPSILMTFLVGAGLLIIGMLFFNVGVALSMTPIGERTGTIMTKSKNLFIVILVSFIMGFVITISEPDLQVLAQQVPSIPNITLILAVALGVAIFLVLAILRMLIGIPLSYLLVFFYIVIFAMTPFVSKDFLSVAFDSGGVASGSMTATFLLPFAMGACQTLGGNIIADAFGCVAMVAMTPLITIPLSSIGGKEALQFLIESEEYQKEEESTLKNTVHDLIVVIAEQGHTDLIMDAARGAGAYGGTVIHAKGTGMEAAEKFMGGSIATEKELVFIVTKSEEKNKIMQAIMTEAGLDSKAKAICFSLPVTDTAGLRLLED